MASEVVINERSKGKKNETLVRILTSIVGLGILLPVIWKFRVPGVEWVCFFAVGFAADEFASMSIGKQRWRDRATMIFFSILIYVVMVWEFKYLDVATVMAMLFIMFQGVLGDKDNALGEQYMTRMLSGMILTAMPISCIALVANFRNGLWWVILVLGATWFADAGAYFAGRALGKTKLAPVISPKKTWEGLIGGVILSIISTCVIKGVWMPEVEWSFIVFLAPLLGATSVVGDLVMSRFKRVYQVKDTGWVLPGHGGVLDRIDGLLVTMPLTWLLVNMFNVA